MNNIKELFAFISEDMKNDLIDGDGKACLRRFVIVSVFIGIVLLAIYNPIITFLIRTFDYRPFLRGRTFLTWIFVHFMSAILSGVLSAIWIGCFFGFSKKYDETRKPFYYPQRTDTATVGFPSERIKQRHQKMLSDLELQLNRYHSAWIRMAACEELTTILMYSLLGISVSTAAIKVFHFHRIYNFGSYVNIFLAPCVQALMFSCVLSLFSSAFNADNARILNEVDTMMNSIVDQGLRDYRSYSNAHKQYIYDHNTVYANTNASCFLIENGVLKKFKKCAKCVTIPNGVTKIGKNAFKHHSEIEKVIIPSSVRAIDDYAFYGCSNLRTIQFDQSTSHEFDYIGSYSFAYCDALAKTNIFIHDFYSTIREKKHSTVLGSNIFEGSGITSPENGLQAADFYPIGCFKACDHMIHAKTALNTNTIEDNCFEECLNLRSFEGSKYQDFRKYSNRPNEPIFKGLTYIGKHAFKYCFNLTETKLWEGTPDHPEAFEGCEFNDFETIWDD